MSRFCGCVKVPVFIISPGFWVTIYRNINSVNTEQSGQKQKWIWLFLEVLQHRRETEYSCGVESVFCGTAFQLEWISSISRYIPALSRCHLSHSGPARRCQQHHLSGRQKSERTHLENLLLRTFSRRRPRPRGVKQETAAGLQRPAASRPSWKSCEHLPSGG